MILYQFYSFDAISDWMLFFSDLIVQICHKITHSYKNMFIKSKFKQKRIVRGQGNRTLLYWNYIQFSSNFLRKKNIMHVNLYSFQTLPISNLFWSHFVMIFQIRWVNFLSSFKMNIISIGFMMQNFYWMKIMKMMKIISSLMGHYFGQRAKRDTGTVFWEIFYPILILFLMPSSQN